jgi:hypothetical protein
VFSSIAAPALPEIEAQTLSPPIKINTASAPHATPIATPLM